MGHNKFMVKFVKSMHLDNFYRKLYFYLFKPINSRVSQNMGNISAEFHVRDYNELIYLTETVVGAADESHVIKTLLKNIKTNDVVYDVGAFLGLHTVFFAERVGECGRVVAFEPSSYGYQALKDNIKLNNLNNVVTINMALGDKIGEATLKGNDSSMYSLSEQFGNSIFNQKTMIMPGDLLVKEKNLSLPNVVKIDVEGYEYLVIKGLEKTLRQSRCRLVCCELHPTLLPTGINSEIIIDILKDYGFNHIDICDRRKTFHAFCYKI